MVKYKRWYDHDPLLMEVIELLKYFKTDFREQAEVFLKKIESQVSKESIDSFYKMVHPEKGNRWYDDDPVISKAIELLRVMPPEMQKQVAQNFLDTLEKDGISMDMIKKAVKEEQKTN